MITYLDTQVGIIMDLVASLGLDKNTIIMFSSDNGTTFNGGVDAAFFNSTGGLKGLKMTFMKVVSANHLLYAGRGKFLQAPPRNCQAHSTT
ncbi:sulfatase-like hydrolase/transferase [Chitinophaga polysaccharea]|uniref:sulfatase-like hydrolase/transferase n=1 Tax=Chitinophaga polysaccharea TaxID=1293035 RepID=UPI0021AFD0A2|nr:sulfatase-like hydrolase/transferase [Chitinophaga polysaccharea]